MYFGKLPNYKIS